MIMLVMYPILMQIYLFKVEPRKLKFQYINGILCYVPSYAIESFMLKDVGKDIVVDPFHPKFPGVYLHSENNVSQITLTVNVEICALLISGLTVALCSLYMWWFN